MEVGSGSLLSCCYRNCIVRFCQKAEGAQMAMMVVLPGLDGTATLQTEFKDAAAPVFRNKRGQSAFLLSSTRLSNAVLLLVLGGR